jgi:GTPase
MYKAEGSYGCWLVRLTPRGVEEIMEVRVAVVGNVDAGKSTTLGVLTRGGLDDGRGKVSNSITDHHHSIAHARLGSLSSVIHMRSRQVGPAL